jgi:hypothetical protein
LIHIDNGSIVAEPVGISDRESGSDGRRVVVPFAESESEPKIVDEPEGGRVNGSSPLAQSVVPEDVQEEEDDDDDKSGKGDGETDQLIKK